MNNTVIELISETSPEALLNELHKLRLLGHLCDVTIQVEHQGVIEEFGAHRPVLAAASKYFKEQFLGEKAENGPVALVCLQDMQAADFASFLEFVYTARLEVEKDRVQKILEVAKALECCDLVETCSQVENIDGRAYHMQVKAEASLQPVCSELLIHLDGSCKGGMKTGLQSGKPADKAERKKEASKAVQAKSRRSSTRLAGRKVFVDIPKKKYTRTLKEEQRATEETRTLKEEQRATEETSDVGSSGVGQSTPDAEMEEEEEVTGVQAESAQQKDFLDNDNQDVAEEGCNDHKSEMEEDHPKDLEESDKGKSEMFRCDTCQRDFQYEKSYLKHIQLSHGIIPVIIYRCDTCNQTFANRCNLKSHQRHVHSNERNFPCEICTKMFKRKKDVKRHVLQVHEGGGERHMCPQCGKSLSSKTALKLHERTHTGDKPYECPECETKFSQPSALKTHRRIHTGEKPFICDECGAKFTQNHMLIYHKRCHTGEKPFMCEICGKSFASKEYLKHHSRMHTGSKPFKCDVCARTFAQRNSLHQHLKVHTGERPYCCDQCGKQFTQLNALQRHHRIHTGEKPYMCRLCGRKFTDKSTVRRHTMIHDKETHWKNFLVILDSNSKKDPKRRMKQGDQTEFSKLHEESSSCSETMADQTEAAPEETRIESEQVPSATEWNSAGPAAITLVNQGASIATALSGFTVIHTDAAQHHLQAMVNIEHIGETNTQVVSLDNQVGITVPVCIPVLSQINNILTRSSATVQDPSSTAVPMPSEEPQLTVMHNVSIQAVEGTANNVNCIVPPEM